MICDDPKQAQAETTAGVSLAHCRKAFQTHRCASLGCFVLHVMRLSFVVLAVCKLFLIVMIEDISTTCVLDRVCNVAVACILCRDHAGARGCVCCGIGICNAFGACRLGAAGHLRFTRNLSWPRTHTQIKAQKSYAQQQTINTAQNARNKCRHRPNTVRSESCR